MKDYKEEIEKETEKYAVKDFADKSSFEFHTQYTSFIVGVNSKIAERIKIEFAIKLLEEIRDEYFESGYNCYSIENKISELENELI